MALLLASVALGGAGQLVFKAAVNRIGALQFAPGTVAELASSPLLWLGLFIYGASALLWLVALMRLDLSFAYPFIGLTYVIVLGGAAVFFNDRITPLRVLGAAVIVAGLVVIAWGARRRS
jgi:drug/metabolite transporter (DMT)-like permease